jgi:hypothetical protein
MPDTGRSEWERSCRLQPGDVGRESLAGVGELGAERRNDDANQSSESGKHGVAPVEVVTPERYLPVVYFENATDPELHPEWAQDESVSPLGQDRRAASCDAVHDNLKAKVMAIVGPSCPTKAILASNRRERHVGVDDFVGGKCDDRFNIALLHGIEEVGDGLFR